MAAFLFAKASKKLRDAATWAEQLRHFGQPTHDWLAGEVCRATRLLRRQRRARHRIRSFDGRIRGDANQNGRVVHACEIEGDRSRCAGLRRCGRTIRFHRSIDSVGLRMRRDRCGRPFEAAAGGQLHGTESDRHCSCAEKSCKNVRHGRLVRHVRQPMHSGHDRNAGAAFGFTEISSHKRVRKFLQDGNASKRSESFRQPANPLPQF